jgi:putative aminopeptidase FrvX
MRILTTALAAGFAMAVALSPSFAAAEDRTESLLRELTDAPGPPGFEEAVRKVMVREMRPLADSIAYDGLGSVIATQGGRGPKIMVDAHMDELGGMVRRTTSDGFLTMQMLGGWLDQALVGQRWIIIGSKGPVHAVSGIRDVHVLPADARNQVFPRDSIFLDVGARNPGEVAAMGVSPGDPVVPDSPFVVMNGTQNYMGKAWDDRVGCAILIEAMRRLKGQPHPNQLVFVATVQEEIGLRGAQSAVAVVKPDAAIAFEAGVAGDAPGSRPEETQAAVGRGPGIFLYDSSAIPNRRFVALVKETARAHGLPLQLDLVQGYGDDSAEIQRSNGGVPTVNLVVPTRYTHAHTGVINRRDFDQSVELVVALLQTLDAATVARLRNFEPE